MAEMQEVPYLDNATSWGADWPLILARIEMYLLKIEIFKTPDFNIAIKISHL